MGTGGRIWLRYESGNKFCAESFASGLAAIERAAAVLNLGATGLSIENAQGETILNAAEIALAVKSLDDIPKH